ncbi:hypothetical protein NLI96_g7153 [Meripilus lineatus]|uniref:Uncharacterized protein n=1 Tax=Meripilus lineatus TaxID=2056292 RepID=A0AAD5V023_9APHY|nr:hypothetical protein NLI96_g7153 [Physisporinus lineatus]
MSLRSSPKPAQSTSTRPIFVAAVPRACSTAFERVRDLSQFLHPLASRHTEYPAKQVFMTCPDQVECIHEPFGEPYYYGPERLGFRFNAPDQTDVRSKSGHPETTYRHIFDLLIQKHNFLQKDVATNQAMARRLFIKDIGHYLIPPSGPASSVVPSLKDYSGSFSNISTSTSTSPSPSDLMSDRSNPTVVLVHLLSQFQFAFLIRHPQSSIPSYYRFTVPPLSQNTGFTYFEPTEVGFAELRVLFDLSVIVLDADDLLDNPPGYVAEFCSRVCLSYSPAMLEWGPSATPGGARLHTEAEEKFRKWKGFHGDALSSTGLKARTHKKKLMTDQECLDIWTKSYGVDAAEQILHCVHANIDHYNYLKQFSMKLPPSTD